MTTPSVASEWKWSDQFLPAMKAIVGPYLLKPAPLAIDRNEAADLVVLGARNLTVACRIRRAAYAAKFRGQFTLRAGRPSGRSTEFEKIASGFGDILLYGFEAPGTYPAINPWYLIDLRAFRRALIMNPKSVVHGEIQNPADGVVFKWFRLDSFPKEPPILIAQSELPNKPAPEMRQSA